MRTIALLLHSTHQISADDVEEYCASSEGSSESLGEKEREQSQDSSSSGTQGQTRPRVSPSFLATFSEGEDGDVARHITRSSQKVFINALFPAASLPPTARHAAIGSDPAEGEQGLGSSAMWSVDYVLLLQGLRVELEGEVARLAQEMEWFVRDVFPAMEAYVLQPPQPSLDRRLAMCQPLKMKQPMK